MPLNICETRDLNVGTERSAFKNITRVFERCPQFSIELISASIAVDTSPINFGKRRVKYKEQAKPKQRRIYDTLSIRVFRKSSLSFGRRLSFENLIHLYFQNSDAVLRCRHPCRRRSSWPPYIPILERGESNTRSKQKSPAGVLVVRWGLIFVKRRSSWPHISKINLSLQHAP